jgi:hypothetical protein
MEPSTTTSKQSCTSVQRTCTIDTTIMNTGGGHTHTCPTIHARARRRRSRQTLPVGSHEASKSIATDAGESTATSAGSSVFICPNRSTMGSNELLIYLHRWFVFFIQSRWGFVTLIRHYTMQVRIRIWSIKIAINFGVNLVIAYLVSFAQLYGKSLDCLGDSGSSNCLITKIPYNH